MLVRVERVRKWKKRERRRREMEVRAEEEMCIVKMPYNQYHIIYSLH